jgi:flavorubredoxin
MHCVRKISEDIYWVGGNDHRLQLFENIHPLPRGVSYNSYLLLDEKTVLFDTVDKAVGEAFLNNVAEVLAGRNLDYLIITHMEPDHAAAIDDILLRYPEVTIITSKKAVTLLQQFGFDAAGRSTVVQEGDSHCFGKHTISFIAAPMVHWPEVMMGFDENSGILFSSDAFGSFAALDGKLFNDEADYDCDWLSEARRYYTNIVGKYGQQVQAVLKKAANLPLKMICPLHGLVWRSDLGYIIDKYQHWSSYQPEEAGVLIAYASMYGHTEAAAQALASLLAAKGVSELAVYDVSKTPVSYLIAEAFRYSHIVLASVTYNLQIFPPMHNFLLDMKALNLKRRTFAVVENGSWSCQAGTLMEKFISEMQEMTVLPGRVTLASALTEDNYRELDALAARLVESLSSAAAAHSAAAAACD